MVLHQVSSIFLCLFCQLVCGVHLSGLGQPLSHSRILHFGGLYIGWLSSHNATVLV